jgi:predicted house-cleaning noncanonical NTP pyrophosphatase (MazG superfamily)
MQHHKLVRDNIPAICQQNGSTAVTRVLDEAEYQLELDKKLQEELAEYLENGDPEELADILEVVAAIAATKGISPAALEAIRAQKAAKRGVFAERIFLIETVDTQAAS